MALITLNGSGLQTSSSNTNEGVKPVVTLEQKYDASILLTEESVQKSFFNEDYVREEMSEAVADALAATVTGASIYVTYFNMTKRNVADRSQQSDNVLEYDALHHSFFKILKFEMKVQGSFEFNFNQSPSVSEWKGSAFLYPYFKPNIGDYFLYEVENGVVGLFKVNNTTRLSIRSATWTRIDFELVKLPVTDTDDTTKMLEDSVSETFYFNTEAFLASNGALLTTTAQETINQLTIYRSNLIRYYYNKFFDNSYHHTFVKPDGVYDPYLVEFWYQLDEPCKGTTIPTRLITKPVNMERSIWYLILHPDDKIKDPVFAKYDNRLCVYRVWETTINSLINKSYVYLHDTTHSEEEEDYPLCDYITLASNSVQIGTILKNYLVDRLVNTELLINEILSVPEKDITDMFYQVPFLIFLCDCVIRKLKYG